MLEVEATDHDQTLYTTVRNSRQYKMPAMY